MYARQLFKLPLDEVLRNAARRSDRRVTLLTELKILNHSLSVRAGPSFDADAVEQKFEPHQSDPFSGKGYFGLTKNLLGPPSGESYHSSSPVHTFSAHWPHSS